MDCLLSLADSFTTCYAGEKTVLIPENVFKKEHFSLFILL